MPSVAEMQALGHHKKIRYITRTTCTACILLGSLCTTVFYFGGNFAGTILFHNTDAGLYIRTLSFICPFLYTNIALTSILNGLGKNRNNTRSQCSRDSSPNLFRNICHPRPWYTWISVWTSA